VAIINYLTTIRFDHGAARFLADEVQAVGITKALVITDSGIVRAGVLAGVLAASDLPIRSIFAETPPNPTEEVVNQAVVAFRDGRCDGFIAIGGGSSIDLAKGAALAASHDSPLEGYAMIFGGAARITPQIPPVVAVPTTAGTGSEVGRGALITLRDGRKLGFISPHLIPKRAICDPDLTTGLPSQLTAATGMDALTHCIEAYLSPHVNPPADAIALDGARRAWCWINTAVQDGGHRQARWEMMMASLEGGLSFQKGLGAVHAMSHPLGGLRDPVLHHGTLNAVILPTVLRFNESVAREKYIQLKAVFGLPGDSDLAIAIERLNAQLGLPASLREMGVPSDVIPTMVQGALKDHSSASNPRRATADDYVRMFEAAMG